ncbi:hypothetical protein GQ42DRAFT_165318 [Ramicandelaber brevisporus]|nr:hypothetical protein GQ42DRAFT_165318 [Ramicandelaber brevisporus]
MKVSFAAALVTILALANMASALKCACEGGSDVSRRACNAATNLYGTSGCGFTGCCVLPSEVERFAAACRSIGSRFLRCGDCTQC